MARLTRAHCASGAAILALLFGVSPSEGKERVQLKWIAPQACPSEQYVLRRVTRLAASAPGEALRVRGQVKKLGAERWTVELQLAGAVEGTRILEAESCVAVSKAAALIIALAIDPLAGSNLSDDEEASGKDEEDPWAKDSTQREASEKPTSSARSEGSESSRTSKGGPRGMIHAGVLLEGAVLPETGLGFQLGGGVNWGWFRSDLTFGAVPSVNTTLPERETVRGHFLFGWLSLRTCAGQDFRRVGVHACASFRPGWLRGSGTGAAQNFSESVYVPSVGTQALLRFPGTARLGVELGAGITVPLTRPVFIVQDLDVDRRLQIHRPQMGATLELALSYRL